MEVVPIGFVGMLVFALYKPPARVDVADDASALMTGTTRCFPSMTRLQQGTHTRTQVY